MYDIESLPGYINVGNQNEAGATVIEFDMLDWSDLASLAVAANPGVSDGLWLTYTRQGETTVYPADAADLDYTETTDDGEITAAVLEWTVSGAVTAIEGMGTLVVHLTDTGVEKCSSRTQIMIEPGHDAPGDPPAPWQTRAFSTATY